MDKEWMERQWSARSRRSSEQSIGDIIRELTQRGVMGDKLTEVQIIGIYEEVVGTSIARQTERLYVRRGTLYLGFSSSALRNEMLYSRGRILELINERLGSNSLVDIVIV